MTILQRLGNAVVDRKSDSRERFRDKANDEGFTLIELLVVIIILGILAAVVVFSVSGINSTGQDAACEIDTRTLRTAAEANFAENDNYTGTTPDPAPTDWDSTVNPSAPNGTQIMDSTLVDNGFLSEPSTMHNLFLVDLNPAVGATSTGVRVVVEDADCGTVGAATGTCGTVTPPAALIPPEPDGSCSIEPANL